MADATKDTKKVKKDDIDTRIDDFVRKMNQKLEKIRTEHVKAQEKEQKAAAAKAKVAVAPKASASSQAKGAAVPKAKAPATSKAKVPVVQKKVPQIKVVKRLRVERTPESQAEKLVGPRPTSWTCSSAHLADQARHVRLTINGKIPGFGGSKGPEDQLTEEFSKEFKESFIKAWGEVMKEVKLKNYKGKEGWAPGDAYHLEMPEGKLAKGSDKVKKCLTEYERLVGDDENKKNSSIEKNYKTQLKEIRDAKAKENKTGEQKAGSGAATKLGKTSPHGGSLPPQK